MADSLIRDRGKESNPEIHLFSDGAVPDLDEFNNQALPLIYHKVGTRANNIGITALDVKANPEDASQRAIYVSVANFSTNQQETDLELRLDGDLLETRHIKIAPAEVSPQIFLASQSHDGVFSVHSTLEDDLAVDNDASIVSLLPHPVKALLVTQGNRFLERALRAAPNVELTVASELTDDSSQYDFIVLDDVLPAVWPKGNVLAINVANTNWFEGAPQTLDSPPIVDWRVTHPILRYVGFDTVHVAKSQLVKTPSWGVSLVDSPQAPLIIAGELGRQRILWIAFNTTRDSDWLYRVSYPIFIANAAEWLNPATERNSQLLVHAGEPFHLNLPNPSPMPKSPCPVAASAS
jgi:hypothetical protein